jgi:hypothetical protein
MPVTSEFSQVGELCVSSVCVCVWLGDDSTVEVFSKWLLSWLIVSRVAIVTEVTKVTIGLWLQHNLECG